jgi:predicted RNA-binding protein YlxR (DUF448 family)
VLAIVQASEIDHGPAAGRDGVERLCIVTRVAKPIDALIRYVVDPSGRVVPDLDRKLPGRGAWVTASRSALESAVEKKAFARAFRGAGSAGPELADLVERLLENAALSALSLANKAGQVITGYSRVEAALAQQNVAALVQASDAAAAGARKLGAAAHHARSEPVRIGIFRGEQLDLALGRSNVVHAVLLVHPASTGFLARCQRLIHWRTGGPAGESGVLGAASRN